MNKSSLFLPIALNLQECQQIGAGEAEEHQQESDVNTNLPPLPEFPPKCDEYPYYPCSELIC